MKGFGRKHRLSLWHPVFESISIPLILSNCITAVAKTGFGPLMFRCWSGHCTHGDSHLIVSNGIGNWFPLRTRAPAEIIHLSAASDRLAVRILGELGTKLVYARRLGMFFQKKAK